MALRRGIKGRLKWAGTIGGAVALLLLVLPNIAVGLPVLNNSNWAAGCNGNPYGVLTWPTPYGSYSYTAPNPSVSTGALSQVVGASAPVHGDIQVASWLMVGPNWGPHPGCYVPGGNLGGLVVTYTWQITEKPYLAANCSGGSAQANLSSNATGNVHINASPWYVAPGASSIVSIIGSPVQQVSCSGSGSNVWSPGTLTWGSFAVRFPLSGGFSVTAGNTYDSYTSIWTNASAEATNSGGEPTATAVSLDTVTATLLTVSCPVC